MKIPKYWGRATARGQDRRGKPMAFACWGWSDASADEARGRAESRAEEILAKFLADEQLRSYPYGAQPMREEIVQVLPGRGGETAIVTRNAYGALVLNTARAMFMDIDLEPDRRPGLFSRLFASKKPVADARGLDEVQKWADRHREYSLRVYRTRAGLRVLVTNQTFNPTTPETEALMKELNCDPLYIRLCRRQECFRARLTPKPWRCGVRNPPAAFPFVSEKVAEQFRKWDEGYSRACSRFGVCRLEAKIGSEVHREVEPVLALHDKYCCAHEGFELA